MADQTQEYTEEFVGAVGIDLGTTYSCVGVWQDDRVVLLPNDQGRTTTPSFVAFTECERLIGDAALNQASRNPENTIFGAKRLIGRSFSEPSVKKDIKNWPFEVIDQDDKPTIQCEYQGKTRSFLPEEISGMVLTHMKRIAEKNLGKRVTKAVVTVPAYFNDSQRQATQNAGRLAGLEVLRIINEPTAAALAYGLDTQSHGHVLIFDLGGGTFDVSLLEIEEGVYKVLATGGDTHLGGEDFDNRLVEHCRKEFLRKTKIDELSSRALRRLRGACEHAKRALSTMQSTMIDVEALQDDHDFSLKLTRAKFEQLNADLFDRCCNKVVAQVLEDAKVPKTKVDHIVLVGGSTRIPKVQSLLTEFFGGKELSKRINPDEAVAYGAAVQAAILTRQMTTGAKDLLLVDVVPLSLGIECTGGVMSTVIRRNTSIPTRKTKTFTTEHDNQTSVDFPVYQGERKLTKDNVLLGNFSLHGIPPAKRNVPELVVTFDLDCNGVLTVTAKDSASGKEAHITIEKSSSHLDQSEVDRMLNESKAFAEEDRMNTKKVEMHNDLMNYCLSLQESMDGNKAFDTDFVTERGTVQDALDECMDWMSDNPAASLTVEEIAAKKKQVEAVWNPVVAKLYRAGRK